MAELTIGVTVMNKCQSCRWSSLMASIYKPEKLCSLQEHRGSFLNDYLLQCLKIFLRQYVFQGVEMFLSMVHLCHLGVGNKGQA